MNYNSINVKWLKTYNNMSNWGKILFFIIIFLLLCNIFKKKQTGVEGFSQQTEQFSLKIGDDIYDSFYSSLYDIFMYNTKKSNYEIESILDKTVPTDESVILDIGSGTGHHVARLAHKKLNVIGIDKSDSMLEKAKNKYPKCQFYKGDGLDTNQFGEQTFTHILCLGYTIYHIKDKRLFFDNCYKWLKKGGYLVLHLVERNYFNSKMRTEHGKTHKDGQEDITKIDFEKYTYTSKFDLNKDTNIAMLYEKFKDKSSDKVRSHQHILYMEEDDDIVHIAQESGFILDAKVDLMHCNYAFENLYIFQK